jgi:DNA modification methylase
MEYIEFLKTKQKRIIESGFEVKKLNDHLFPFEKFIVDRALKAGKYAIFADTGLGKTIMQLEWAHQVVLHTKQPVLILAPLAVNIQTIEEGKKFGIKVWKYGKTSNPLVEDNAFDHFLARIYISNYEQLDNIDCSVFSGIVLDESSILKNFNGKYRTQIINTFQNTPYKLACTATPSPNDPMELGNHAQFLDVMSYNEMLAMYFIHDSSDTGLWRLKGHAIELFYEFVSTWSIMLNKPGDIGFSNEGYDLPPLNINQVSIETELLPGLLFGGSSVNATDFNRTLRETESLRLYETVKIIKSIDDEQIIVWCKQNEEAKNLCRMLIENSYNVRNVQGSDSPEKKEKDLIEFAHGEYQIMITKTQIASFGMNFQNCHYQIFASLDFSFESVYQAMRRSWRFGQTREVNIWMITTDRMINVTQIINEKELQFKTMQKEITKAVNKNIKGDITHFSDSSEDVKTDQYWVMRGDCVQRIKEVHDNSIDLMVFSPPFADLYTYSNYVEDMGNVADYDEFVTQFTFLVKEIKRTLKQGRLCAVHCMDLPTQLGRDGYMGIKRFSSKIADIFENEDMFLHSEFTIWKDPLLAAVRTKALGLAHKQVTKDMSRIRMGLADKVMVFKKRGDNEVPIQLKDKRFTSYIPMHQYDNFPRTSEGFNEFWGFDPDSVYDRVTQYSHQVWQRYASPVWMDIDVTNVLQYTTARDQNDEKHICPLQLDVIERIILLYSNEGETVLSPFGGIGSEGYQALKMNRKSISIELKKSYFDINCKNHRNAVEQKTQMVMFE